MSGPETLPDEGVGVDMEDHGEAMPLEEGQMMYPEEYLYGEEEEEEDTILPEASALLERPQKTLHDQYSRMLMQIEGELRERVEELKRYKKQREDTGVELYSVQQQLARLQLTLKKADERAQVAGAAREHVESHLVEYRKLVSERAATVAEEEAKRATREADLLRLQEMMRQVELYQKEMRDQIAVTRRATYKAEETVSEMEREKATQDDLVENLSQQVAQLQEKIALVEAQYLAQQNESGMAAETLAQANAEMAGINAEKKQLVQHWRSALIGMQRRDEALQNAENNLRQQWELIMALEGELRGFRPRLAEQQALNEKLVLSLNRVRTEDAFLSRQVEQAEQQRRQLEQQFHTFKLSQEHLEVELARVAKERDAVRVQAARMERELQKVLNSLNEFDDSMGVHSSEQMTLARSAQGAKTDLRRLNERIREQEALATQLKNQLARVRLECLEVGSVTTERQKELDRLNAEMAEQDRLVERYTQEIARRHDEIEKKQVEVDRLNRRYEQMTSNLEEAEHLGPLEATIHNLTKAIAQMRQEVQDLEHAWIKRQTELVALVNAGNEQSERIQELHSQANVLNSRRIRLDGELDEQNKELKALEASMRRLHADISRLNDLIARNRASQDTLAEANLKMENEIVRRLKEEEEESVRLEGQVDAIAQEKQQLMDAIMEAERQILLWEKKIQLGREAMEAIDPTVGSSENAAMLREIQRMEYHLQTIERSKENLIKEMELAVSRREGIAMRGATAARSGREPPRALLARKTIVELSRRLKQGANDTRVCENELRTMLDLQRQLAAEMSTETAALNDARQARQEAIAALSWSTYERQKNQALILLQQRLARRYEQAMGRDPKTYTDEQAEKIRGDLARAQGRTETIRVLVQKIRQLHPDVDEYCERLLHSMTQEVLR